MIDFKISPRQSRKTQELLNRYNQNPGIFITIFNPYIDSRFKNVTTYTYSDDILKYGSNVTSKFKWFYFDEFFNQEYITYDDIILLDKIGKNIVIRGTPIIGENPPKIFISYLEEHYPEYCI